MFPRATFHPYLAPIGGLSAVKQRAGLTALYGERFSTGFVLGEAVQDRMSCSVPFFDRPGGGAIWARCVPGDVLAVARMDALVRSGNIADLIGMLSRLLERGVRLVTIGGVDVSGDAADLQAAMEGMRAMTPHVCHHAGRAGVRRQPMPKFFGYAIAGVRSLSLETQEQDIVHKFQTTFAPAGFSGSLARNNAASASLPLSRRPVAQHVFTAADEGDVIAFADLRAAGKRLDQIMAALAGPLHRSIRFIFIVQAIDTAEAGDMLRALADFERRVRADRATGAAAAKRATCKALNGSSPPGFRLIGRPGARRKAPCPDESSVVDRIRRWHTEEGLSLDEIHIRLLEERARRRTGGEWSRTCIHTVLTRAR